MFSAELHVFCLNVSEEGEKKERIFLILEELSSKKKKKEELSSGNLYLGSRQFKMAYNLPVSKKL